MGSRAAKLIVLAALCVGCGGPRVATQSARDMQNEGVTAYRAGDLIEALQRFRDAVALGPTDTLTHAYLARCYRYGGWEEEGYDHFLELAQLLGDSGEDDRISGLGYYVAAFAAYTGRVDTALVYLRRAREARSPSELETTLIAEALLLAGQADLVVDLLAERAEREEATPEARLNLARALWSAGRLSEAFAEAERLEREFPAHAEALALAALARFAQGDLIGSEALTRRWLRAEPGDPDAVWNLTRIAVAQSRWGAADTLLSTIVAAGY